MEVREVGRRKKPFLLTAELFISRNLFVTDEHKFWSCRTSIFMNASLIQHSFSPLLSRLRHSMRSQSCKLKIPSSSSWQWIATQYSSAANNEVVFVLLIMLTRSQDSFSPIFRHWAKLFSEMRDGSGREARSAPRRSRLNVCLETLVWRSPRYMVLVHVAVDGCWLQWRWAVYWRLLTWNFKELATNCWG